MEVLETRLRNVLLFKPSIFEDFRGVYVETFNAKGYEQIIKEKTGEDVSFVQDCSSRSSRHVLRGIHGDNKTWKLISCPKGKVYAAIVNCNEKSPDFGRWQSFDLSEANMNQVLVPPNFGTSHVVLGEEAMFQYKQSTYYDPKVLRQFSYRYDDPRFNIWWPVKQPVLSQRDEHANTDLAGKSSS